MSKMEEQFLQQSHQSQERIIENQNQKAEEILLKIFSAYEKNPTEDERVMFYNAIYELDCLYLSESVPENTGTLEDDVKTKISPLLEKLQFTHPNAVDTFRKEFFDDVKEDSDEKFHYEDKEAHEYNMSIDQDILFFKSEDNRRRLRENLFELDKKSYQYFTESIGQLSEAYNIPQEYVDDIVRRGMQLFEEQEDQGSSFGSFDSIMCEGVVRNMIGNYAKSPEVLDGSRPREDFETLADKSFKAYIKSSEHYPNATHQAIDQISQNAQILRKDIYIHGIAQLWASESLGKNFRNYMLHGVNYMLSFYEYREVLMEELDFDHQENFYQTGLLLDLMKKTSFLGEQMIFSEGRSDEQATSILEEVVKRGRGSYLLNLRAQNVLNEVGEWKDSSEFGKRMKIFDQYTAVPYPVSKEREGYYDLSNDEFSISDVEGNNLFRPLEPQELLLASGDTVAQEKSNEFFKDYKFLVRPDIMHTVNKEMGIYLAGYSLPEQIQFMQLIKHRTRDELLPVKRFIKQFDQAGLRTFLSMESGGVEMGEKILSIGERFEQETAEQIFAKYGELVDASERAGEYLQEELGHEDSSHAHAIAQKLLLRGKALLSSIADEKGCDVDKVLKKLETITGEVELFKASFKVLKENGGDVSFEELKNVQFQSVSGPELVNKKEVVERMKEIYLQNYADFPEAFVKKIIESLEQKITNPQTRFYLLQHEGKTVAFNSFTQQEDGTVHFANFNVDPQYNYSKLGDAMMEATLDRQAQHATIIAEGVSDAPITKTYIERKGFNKVGEVDIGGVTLWQLRREQEDAQEKDIKVAA